ncbi:hypothetical protein CY34DRAFT_352150 [Suillus luteus UH-Slu-Lm8-n1]|uniref:Uncharacterized protein n=1 Tax=Suillus luteus UH-Slu-Lm8-n1 TaxID=930992 RepID=A0A0D0ABD3_9AGAM|nr:hypothetical protein CY34DRAFT_352150 [Suillus luteus UH-Slu-Lm8-n1]
METSVHLPQMPNMNLYDEPRNTVSDERVNAIRSEGRLPVGGTVNFLVSDSRFRVRKWNQIANGNVFLRKFLGAVSLSLVQKNVDVPNSFVDSRADI